MKRPKISDFTPDYTKNKGALYVQYTIAQDEYIDYLESKINLSLGNVIEKYSIKIDNVANFRHELIKLIEQIRDNNDEYKNVHSSQVAASFEKKVNSL